MWIAAAIVWYKDCLFHYEEDFLFLFEEYVLVKDFCTYSLFVSREVREQEVKTWKMTDLLNFYVLACWSIYVIW